MFGLTVDQIIIGIICLMFLLLLAKIFIFGGTTDNRSNVRNGGNGQGHGEYVEGRTGWFGFREDE